MVLMAREQLERMSALKLLHWIPAAPYSGFHSQQAPHSVLPLMALLGSPAATVVMPAEMAARFADRQTVEILGRSL